MLCRGKKKGSGEGEGGGKESNVREQDLRELNRAERSRDILHNDG